MLKKNPIHFNLQCATQTHAHTHACIHIIWILLLSDWNLSLTLLVKKIKKSYMKSITELPSFPLLLSPPSFSPSLPPLSRKERGLLWSAVCWFIALIHYCVYLTCLRKHVDGSYSASLFFFFLAFTQTTLCSSPIILGALQCHLRWEPL